MFKHYLNFISLPQIGTIEIAEPIGFDKASYKVKQDDKRFGRDIIIANEDTELTFTREFFERLNVTQSLPNGQTFNDASLGFDYLIDVFNNDGWEGKVEYIIQKDETTFSTGIFSYATAVVEFDNIKVRIIQNTNREVIKRLEDTDVDAFNNKALDNRDITPCATTDILLKAKPIFSGSTWGKTAKFGFTYSNLTRYINPTQQITTSNINNTLTSFSDVENSLANAMQNFKYIYAQNDITNVNLKSDVSLKLKFNITVGGRGVTKLYYGIWQGTTFNPSTADYGVLYTDDYTGTAGEEHFINENFDFNFPFIPRGYNFSFFWSFQSFISGGVTWLFNDCNVNITATSTAIDTIVKGIRLIDLAKHNVKSLANVNLIAPEYDLGGEHYDNFAFNGLLLGQITDKPFNNKFKELMQFSDETCSDIQINPNSVELLPYADYYADVEMAEFDELPSFEAKTNYNKRYTLKTADFKYKRSSSERETNGKNSIDDVHTETQKFITDTVDSNLKVEISHIRSAFLIEEARQRAFDNQETTSLQNDDNLFILKCVPLAPSTQGGFGAVLLQQIDNTTNNLKILNNNTDGNGIDFNWLLLGFKVGDSFFIDVGTNSGTYTVISITTTVIELHKVLGVPTFEGEEFIKLRWFYTNVLYTNQTNEGYSLIEGVSNPNDYSNLDYCWGRNIKRWYSYLATATKFKKDGIIKTASFKTNGNLITKKIGESTSLADSADIINSEIADLKILNPNIHSVKVYADFNKITQLIEDVQNVKGYVTVNLNDGRKVKGFIKELDYSWIKEELDLDIEEKFEGDFMEITECLIKYPQYPDNYYLKSFQINNIFVLLFDGQDIQLYPPVRFTNIKINGVAYTDIILFNDALETLING